MNFKIFYLLFKKFLSSILGSHPRQTRQQKHVRMSMLQDATAWTNIRVDIQFKDKRQTRQMGFGWSRASLADISKLQKLYSHTNSE